MRCPAHAESAARGLRMPGGVGEDRDAGHEAIEGGAPLEDEDLLDPGRILHLIEVRARDLRAEDRGLLVDGVQHPWDGDIDREDRCAADDLRVVDVRGRAPDDAEVFGILERDRGRIGDREGGCGRGECAVGEATLGCAVDDDPRLGGALCDRDLPRLRRGGEHELASDRAGAPERLPVHGGRGAPSLELPAVARFVERRLFDGDRLPLHIELLGDQHREHRLDPLTRLWVLGDDRDHAIGGDAEEGVRGEGGVRAGGRFSGPERGGAVEIDQRADEESATGERGDAEEGAAIGHRVAPARLITAARLIPSRMRW